MDINTKPDGGSKARSGAEADSEQLLAQVGVVSPGTVADYQRQGWIVLAGPAARAPCGGTAGIREVGNGPGRG